MRAIAASGTALSSLRDGVELRRLASSSINPSRWRPEATAPWDESVLTIRAGTKIPWVASKDEDGWTSFNMIYETHMAKYEPGRKFAPTHWRPLPKAPKA